MVVESPVLPLKRRLGTEHMNAARRNVIELSDSESESTSQSPPAKRQKSDTPSENRNQPSLLSRGRPEYAKASRSTVPIPSRSSHDRHLNGVSQPGSQSVSAPPVPKPLRNLSTKSIEIYDLTLESDSESNPPSRHASITLPTRNTFQSLGSPLRDTVQTVRKANAYHSPYTGPPENGRDRLRRDVSSSRSSSSSIRPWEKKGPDTEERTATLQPSVSTGFTLEIPKKVTPDRGMSGSQLPTKQATFEVVVNSPNNLLNQFQRPPLMSRAERLAERKEVWSSIKHSSKLAHKDLSLVEKHFGQTGFSEAFSTEDKEELDFMRTAASKKKKKKINRADINLEIESLTQSVEDLQLSKRMVHPARTAREILTSRFDEMVDPKLTFFNDVNSKRLHGKFQFVDRYLVEDKVKPVVPRIKGCDCTDCSLSSCSCFTKKVNGINSQLKTYLRRPDGIVVLSDEFLVHGLNPANTKHEVTECNDSCGCGPGCWNRVASNGRTIPLEIFQTESCGFGVRSSQNIVKGQFIELYLGEVITENELRRREDAENDDDPSYLFSLDWFSKTNQSNTLHVDGKYFGSAMRFVNHSCNPNAKSYIVQTHKDDRKLYYNAFFAIRDIKAGVEIRIDYHNKGTASDPEEPDSQDPGLNGQVSEDLSKCHCGAANCRGILWTPGVKARRRRRLAE